MLACRLCGGVGRVMLKLTDTPMANRFPDEPDQDAKRYPVEVTQCHTCDHAQIGCSPPFAWEENRYATPEAVRPHLAEAARVLRGTYPQAKTVLEIGCNNGLYLDELRRVGFEAVGVDPCAPYGIGAIAKPFTLALARTMQPVDLIVANNALGHVDDMADTFAGIDYLLKDHGALVFEVFYLPSMMQTGAFDMIYHEHRDYHTLTPLIGFLKRFGLVIVKRQFIPTHGGSVRIWCERPGVPLYIGFEAVDWRTFQQRIEKEKASVLAQVAEVKGLLVAFGATAKSCTLIHHFGLADRIDYAVDNTPGKQGRYIPGTKIQIHEPAGPLATNMTFLLTAWNFEKEIRAQYPQHKFIVPFSKKEALCPV